MSAELAILGAAGIAGGAYYLSRRSADASEAEKAKAAAETAKVETLKAQAIIAAAQANQNNGSPSQSSTPKAASADAAVISALLATIQNNAKQIPVPLPASYLGSGVPPADTRDIVYALANNAGALSASFVNLAKSAPEIVSGFKDLFSSSDAPTVAVDPNGWVPSTVPGFNW